MLLAAPALAHVPHDRVLAVAAPETGAWLLVASPGRDSLLLRSEDQGATWEFIGGDPVADTLIGAHALGDGTRVLLGEAYVWMSEDEGDSWRAIPSPGGDRLAGVDALRVAGSAGLFEWNGSGWNAAFEGDVTVVAEDGKALVADGVVWVEGSTGWTSWGAPGGVEALVVIDDVVFVGDRSGFTWWARSSEEWSACGARTSEVPEITRMASSGTTLLVADGSGGPWVSVDACATWRDVRATQLDVMYEADGAARSADEGVADLGVSGERWWMAGWGGFAWSTDGGTWTEAVTLPPDYTRGLAFSPSFGADGTVWVGAYAAGVVRTRDAGRSFATVNEGLTAPNIQGLRVWADGEDSALTALVGHKLKRSLDRGESWTGLDTPFVLDDQVFQWPERDHLWAVGRATTDFDDRSIAETWDGGATWDTFAGFAGLLGDGEPRGVAHVTPDSHPEVTCVGSYEGILACTEDDGDTWEGRFSGGGPMTSPVAWPPGAPRRVVLADAVGVHISDDGGRTWSSSELAEDGGAELAVAGDGTLFLTTATGRLRRSVDGGTAWEDLGIRFGGTTFVLEPRPGFSEHDELLVAGADGVWHVIDAAGDPELVRWGAWQRVEESDTYFSRCEDCDAPESLVGASLGHVQRLGAGAVLSVSLRGHTVRVMGASEGDSDVALRIDGVERLRFGDSVGVVGLLASVSDLDDRWHRVELTGIAGEGVLIDGVEAYGYGSALEFDSGTQGCGTGCAAPFVLLFRRRLRRGP